MIQGIQLLDVKFKDKKLNEYIEKNSKTIYVYDKILRNKKIIKDYERSLREILKMYAKSNAKFKFVEVNKLEEGIYFRGFYVIYDKYLIYVYFYSNRLYLSLELKKIKKEIKK